jgi:hypothetical protein
MSQKRNTRGTTIILQSHSNKNSMGLAQKQIWRCVGQNRGPRYDCTPLYKLIVDKGSKNIWWRKDSLFNKCWENWISASKKLKVDPCLSSCTSINSKWIKDINIRPETLRLVQERTGNTLELIGFGNDFLNRTQMAKQLRERIDKWN